MNLSETQVNWSLAGLVYTIRLIMQNNANVRIRPQAVFVAESRYTDMGS